MSDALRTIRLPGGVVYEITNHGCVSRFPDGTTLHAAYVIDAEQRARAASLGYPAGDVAGMHVDHDLAHHVVARALGFPWSPVLHAVASGRTPPPFIASIEERVALLVARAANVGSVEALVE